MTSVRGHPQPTDTWSGAVDRYDTVAGASRLTRCARRTAFLVSYSGLGRLRSHVCKAVFPARQSPALLCPEANLLRRRRSCVLAVRAEPTAHLSWRYQCPALSVVLGALTVATSSELKRQIGRISGTLPQGYVCARKRYDESNVEIKNATSSRSMTPRMPSRTCV